MAPESIIWLVFDVFVLFTESSMVLGYSDGVIFIEE